VEGISNQLLVTSFPRQRKLQVQAHEHLELRLCRTVVRDGELRLCERVDAGTSGRSQTLPAPAPMGMDHASRANAKLQVALDRRYQPCGRL
jgi:hypothetical protein